MVEILSLADLAINSGKMGMETAGLLTANPELSLTGAEILAAGGLILKLGLKIAFGATVGGLWGWLLALTII